MKVAHFLLLLFVRHLKHASATTTPCDLRATKFGFVCVCTQTHCDYLENPKPSGDKDIVVVSSSQVGLRFLTTNFSFEQTRKLVISDRIDESIKNLSNFDAIAVVVEHDRAFLQMRNFKSYTLHNDATKTVRIEVERAQRYQKIVSFGGAYTGAVAHVLQQLPAALQDHVYKSYFHTTGINFNTVRIPIGGCDFDLAPWAYNEQPVNDAQLRNFTKLDARDELKLQQLTRLKQVAELQELKIMAAAWSPPTWMKTNELWTGFSQLKTEYYQTWADYHLKFLDLMNAKNMPIWAISTGNEPLNGVIGWFFVHFMSLGWTPRNQAIWLSEHLGPTIRNSKHRNVLIFGNDDQRYTYPAWFRKMKAMRSSALSYLDGLAVHWYWDDVFAPNLIDEAHREMPEKLLLNTESSIGDKPWQTHGPELGSWKRGEQYMRAYLQDLQHAFNGWIDWNIVLDEKGGPNYVQNYVDAPIIVNTTNRAEFYKQPIYYAIGHFSKFLPVGSVRVNVKISGGGTAIDAVGFERPDGSLALIVYNGGDSRVYLDINDSLRGHVDVGIPARSWHTFIYN